MAPVGRQEPFRGPPARPGPGGGRPRPAARRRRRSGAEPGLPPGRIDPDGGIEQVTDLSPAFRRHPLPSEPADEPGPRSRQSRSTVTTETPSAAATSATVIPPK